MSSWKPNPRIEIEYQHHSVFYPYRIRVRGTYAGQPFTGTLFGKDGFGYHVSLDHGVEVHCPENKWRVYQLTAPQYAGNGYNIEFVSKDEIESYRQWGPVTGRPIDQF
jgi:hypothetical protein